MAKVKIPEVDLASAKAANRGDYLSVLESIVDKDMCPFCEKNIRLHHKKPILFKNAFWIVTENAWPYIGTNHHFLLISRIHIDAIENGSENMFEELAKAYKKLVRKFKLKGATLAIRSGDTAYTGATVRHLHAQIIVGAKRRENSKPITIAGGYQK